MYDQSLQALHLIYEVYHPFYGFQISMVVGTRPATTQEDALAGKMQWLYDINVFGPELVEKIGKVRLETAPAQKIIRFEDGGMMLLPRSYLYPDFSKYSFKEVATHLGLSYPEE